MEESDREYITADEADISDSDGYLTDEYCHQETDEESSDVEEGLLPFKRRRTGDAPTQELSPDSEPAKELTQEPRSSTQRQIPNVQDKRSACPVPGCHFRSKHLKHHAWEYHLPRLFWDRPWNSLAALPEYHTLRASCLNVLGQYVLGPTATIDELVVHVNEEIPLPREYPIMGRTFAQMGQLTRTMRWPFVNRFTMSPVNSPAVLLHWRILLSLVCNLSEEKRHAFKRWGRKELAELEERVRTRRSHGVRAPQEPHRRVEEHDEIEWEVLDECGSEEDVADKDSDGDISSEEEDTPYEVIVLQAGYEENFPSLGKRKMGSSITLLKGSMNIIVDTGNPSDRQYLLSRLSEQGLAVEDIECCVTTHGHLDHMGNLNVFPNAYHVAASQMCVGDLHHFHDFKLSFWINDQIEVVHTPGHTSEDISVLVHASQMGTVAVVGDLFHSMEDLEDASIWRRYSRNVNDQDKNRRRILEVAEYIVPGHGPMFRVPGRE